MTDLARIEAVKARLEAVGQRMVADKAERICERCRWYRHDFGSYRDKDKCANPAVRMLAYSDRRVPRAVTTEKGRSLACGGDGLFWERRRKWHALQFWDYSWLLFAGCLIATPIAARLDLLALFVVFLVSGTAAFVASLFWLIHCSIEGRWSRS